MTGSAPQGSTRALLRATERRLRTGSILANVAGAVVIFAFLVFGLPAPPHLAHQWRIVAINGGVLAGSMVIGLPLGALWLSHAWTSRMRWLVEEREPTDRELALTVRFALFQHGVIGALWALDAVLFGLVNLSFSVRLAFDVCMTVLLGALVMVALGYLLSERQMRPLMARVLAGGVPARPQLPGVAARALLGWTLGTGVVLLGLVLVGGGALVLTRVSETQLAAVVVTLAAAGLAVGGVLTAGLAKSLSEPIDALRASMARVERGELDGDVTVYDGSEIGLLQAGFNRMLAGLRERERMRDLFGRQVGEDVVRHALEHGVELGGETREAAVLFVDLKGSTQMAHERAPADVVRLLNAFFAIVVEVVGAHSGWVNKFEGDGAVCVFGAPIEDASCAGQALAAARELSERLRAEMPELAAGIGISAGPVVAGNVGAARRFEYTVIGDPVNEAARLSELAKGVPGGVLASGAALARSGEAERARWEIDREETLRGRRSATEIARPRAHAAPRARPAERDGAAGASG